jgi:hypothetical protein
MAYQDEQLTCKDCGTEFAFTVSEQEFYAEKGFENKPARCPQCRAARKASNGINSQEALDSHIIITNGQPEDENPNTLPEQMNVNNSNFVEHNVYMLMLISLIEEISYYHNTVITTNAFDDFLKNYMLDYINILKNGKHEFYDKTWDYLEDNLIYAHFTTKYTAFIGMEKIFDDYYDNGDGAILRSLQYTFNTYCIQYSRYFCRHQFDCGHPTTVERYSRDLRCMILVSKDFIEKYIKEFISDYVTGKPADESDSCNQ